MLCESLRSKENVWVVLLREEALVVVSCLQCQKMNKRETQLKAFSRLLDIMERLRVECPWDKKQTISSLRKLTIEETFELADAIVEMDMEEIKKELGDLLLHIVFYSQIASETEQFDFTDVANSICDKLIFRHPHIYGDVKVDDAEQVIQNWESLKLKEKKDKRVLDGVPKSLPPLVKAMRLQEKARGVGFDWDKKEQVWDKVKEELAELQEEIIKEDKEKSAQELGDFLFSVINAARLYGIDPEIALEQTNKKFINRFNYLEEKTITKGRSLHDMNLEEMDALWNEAKSKGL